MDAKKLKLIVRGDKKPTFGTDPNEPWSVRAGITESERGELHAYLKSRGINPDFVSKDTKISHAKSSEFQKWRRDHQFDDPINFVSTTVADRMKKQRAQTEETVAEAKKPKTTSLEKFRKASAEREKKHDEIEKNQSKDGSGMTSAIDRLEKHLNKEETINEVSDSEVQHHFDNWTNSEHAPYNSDAGDDNKVHQSALRYLRSTNVPKENHEKLAMHIAHKFHGSGIDEEVKQIDELKMSTVKSYHKKRLTDFSYANKKPGETSTKPRNARIKKVSAGIDRSIDRQTGYKPTSEETEQIDEKNVPTSPEKWARAKAAAKSKFAVYPSAYANGWASKKYKAMGGGWKSVNEEVDITEKNDSHTHAAHYEDPKTGEWTGMNLLIAKDDDDAIRQANEKCKEGCRLTKVERHITVKEEVEQIDELKKSTVFSWLKQQPVVPEKKPGMTRKDFNKKIKTHSKSWNRALDRLAGYKPTSEAAGVSKTKETQFHKKLDTLVHDTFGKRKDELKMKEDVFQDTQAATQTAFDMGTQADDREPTYSKKKEMSKSARMIKSLYKKHKMVKEELYDHEKEDKSVASYGKKPKINKQEVYSDDDVEAAMVLKGGKTLTGQTRDTLEIDPVMRKSLKPDNQLNNKKTDK